MSQQRYCLVSDESSHEYVIPVEMEDEFQEWAEDEDPEDPGKYDEYRMNCYSLTFTDPQGYK